MAAFQAPLSGEMFFIDSSVFCCMETLYRGNIKTAYENTNSRMLFADGGTEQTSCGKDKTCVLQNILHAIWLYQAAELSKNSISRYALSKSSCATPRYRLVVS